MFLGDHHSFFQTAPRIKNVPALTPKEIRDYGWKGVVLDFDGVMNSHDFLEPKKEILLWIDQMLAQGFKIGVHSNTHPEMEQARKEWLKNHQPQILWLQSDPYKPDPTRLIEFTILHELEPQEVVMIDDRLTTGGLAAWRAGVNFMLVTDPYQDFSYAPWKEMWFSCLRFMEQCFFYW